MSMYPIWIRTPVVELTVEGQWVRFTINAGPVAAGANGENLRAGQTAWPDRPLNPNEPRRVAMCIFQGPVNGKPMELDQVVKTYQKLTFLQMSLLAPNLLVRIKVVNMDGNLQCSATTPGDPAWEPLTIRPAAG